MGNDGKSAEVRLTVTQLRINISCKKYKLLPNTNFSESSKGLESFRSLRGKEENNTNVLGMQEIQLNGAEVSNKSPWAKSSPTQHWKYLLSGFS